MCGFVGITKQSGLDLDVRILDDCRDTLVHRGPDSFGHYIDETTYLGFRRLAILDLTEDGNQPMSTPDKKVLIVFNGEIYNYIELKNKLKDKGYKFRTDSDTEVLLFLYQEYGKQMFTLINGMFAIAIYDRTSKVIILARDRLGKKPLYYFVGEHGLAFASELRALRRLPTFPYHISSHALGIYLRLGWLPNSVCIYENVHKLEPGHYIEYDLKTTQIENAQDYWSLPASIIDEHTTEAEWVDRIEETLLDATRIRLRSDVPLATFLSGGIDSSLVTAAAAKLSGGHLQTLTIGFPEWTDDEWPVAQTTARSLGLHAIHKEVQVDSIRMFPATIAHFDEPFADVSALPTALVCELARLSSTVVLSGDGGDELFAGYDNHRRAWQWRHLEYLPIPARKLAMKLVLPMTRDDSRPRRFARRLGYPVGSWGMGAKIYPFEDWLNHCVKPDYRLYPDAVPDLLEGTSLCCSTTSPIDQAQRLDLGLYLLSDVLVKVDRMSMLHSLEVRSPFLDYRMVEMALQVPPKLRVYGGQNKYLLRCLAKKHLPRAVVNATKRGFGVPLRQWLFESNHSKYLKEIAASPSSNVPEPLMEGGGARLWSLAEQNNALVPALFRVLAYRWWSQGVSSY